MKYYKIIFNNDYIGCQQEMIYSSENDIDEMEMELRIAFNEYMENYEYVAQGFDYMGWESEEDEDCYYNNGCYSVEEVDETEYNELLEQGYELFI